MAKKKAAEPTVETPAEETAPSEKITQRVAVQKALDEGNELPVDGVPYVKEKFGITLSNQAFSTIKSKITTAGKKAKSTAKASVAVPAAARTTSPANGTIGVAGQVEAIKALCDKLGADQVISIAKLFTK